MYLNPFMRWKEKPRHRYIAISNTGKQPLREKIYIFLY
jgi:hypothetical protein